MAQQEALNGGAAEKAVVFAALKPQLVVEAPEAGDAIKFYKSAFGAEELNRTLHPKRRAEQDLPSVLSAQLVLAGTTILVSDCTDESAAPVKAAGTGCVLCLETEDLEAAVAKAVAAGVLAEGEVVDGDGACCDGLVGKVKDPYGFTWLLCSPAKKCVEAEWRRSRRGEDVKSGGGEYREVKRAKKMK